MLKGRGYNNFKVVFNAEHLSSSHNEGGSASSFLLLRLGGEGVESGNSRYGPLHLWSMSLMGHQVVVMVQCNYGPGHLWATT